MTQNPSYQNSFSGNLITEEWKTDKDKSMAYYSTPFEHEKVKEEKEEK